MDTSLPGDLPTRVSRALRDIPDFPRTGILFKDVTPVLGDAVLFREVTEAMAGWYRPAGITRVA
ncbi:MAG: adenine phosphoribosyltransferase, partial [Gemmatirosa sp.]